MHNTLDMVMNSDAVAIVLEMGYSREMIGHIIRRYRQMLGIVPITAEALVEIIVDAEESQTIQINPRRPRDCDIANAFNRATRDQSALQDQHRMSLNTSAAHSSRMGTQEDRQNSRKETEHKSLVEEIGRLREQMMCKICMDRDANIVFLPCGHLVACTECASVIKKCAICRKLIEEVVRAFMS